MRQRFIKMISITTLAALLAVSISALAQEAQNAPEQQRPAKEAAQDESRAEDSRQSSANARKLEGVWESQVTIRVCPAGDPIRTFRGLTLFSRGGSSTATNNNPPSTNSPALGRWEYQGGRRYRAVFRFFRFNPDGTFAGAQRITRNITLSPDGDHLTGTISFEVFDVNDNLIQTGCSTETATRVE